MREGRKESFNLHIFAPTFLLFYNSLGDKYVKHEELIGYLIWNIINNRG